MPTKPALKVVVVGGGCPAGAVVVSSFLMASGVSEPDSARIARGPLMPTGFGGGCGRWSFWSWVRAGQVQAAVSFGLLSRNGARFCIFRVTTVLHLPVFRPGHLGAVFAFGAPAPSFLCWAANAQRGFARCDSVLPVWGRPTRVRRTANLPYPGPRCLADTGEENPRSALLFAVLGLRR